MRRKKIRSLCWYGCGDSGWTQSQRACICETLMRFLLIWSHKWIWTWNSSEVSMNLGAWRKKKRPNYFGLQSGSRLRDRNQGNGTYIPSHLSWGKGLHLGDSMSFLSSVLNPLLHQAKSGLSQRVRGLLLYSCPLPLHWMTPGILLRKLRSLWTAYWLKRGKKKRKKESIQWGLCIDTTVHQHREYN